MSHRLLRSLILLAQVCDDVRELAVRCGCDVGLRVGGVRGNGMALLLLLLALLSRSKSSGGCGSRHGRTGSIACSVVFAAFAVVCSVVFLVLCRLTVVIARCGSRKRDGGRNGERKEKKNIRVSVIACHVLTLARYVPNIGRMSYAADAISHLGKPSNQGHAVSSQT